jgi:small conductance mechanosensitive channel
MATPALNVFAAAGSCAKGDNWCSWVQDVTGNEKLASYADWLVAKPLAIIGLAAITLLLRWFLHRLIERLARRAANGLPTPILRHGHDHISEDATSRRVQRARTMATLLKSITSVVLFVVFGMMAVSELGYPIGPLIASAGIVGIALGFGAQSLVKDFLAGISMIFEDQYGVGDSVDLGEASGTVESVGLRVTRLRDVEGTVWYVRNGEILRVGNHSQNWARTVLDIPVPHNQDLRRVERVLGEVAQSMWEDEDFRDVIIEEPEVWGVQELTADHLTVRVTLKTLPLEQWRIAREMRHRIQSRFDQEKIPFATPTRLVWDNRPAAQPAAPPDEKA